MGRFDRRYQLEEGSRRARRVSHVQADLCDRDGRPKAASFIHVQDPDDLPQTSHTPRLLLRRVIVVTAGIETNCFADSVSCPGPGLSTLFPAGVSALIAQIKVA